MGGGQDASARANEAWPSKFDWFIKRVLIPAIKKEKVHQQILHVEELR